MKPNILRYFLVIAGALFLFHVLKAQEVERISVTYAENANKPNLSARAKAHHNIQRATFKEFPPSLISSRRGLIQATCDHPGFLSVGMERCLKLAMDSWEDKLDIKLPIKFHFESSEDMNENTAIRTTVGYSRNSQFLITPDNLYKQSLTSDFVVHDTIVINPSWDWYLSWPCDGVEEGSIRLTTALLRHIGHILGFGTSIINKADGLGFPVGMAHSKFDSMITNGETFLSDTKKIKTSQDIENFFAKPLTLHTSASDYSLYNEGSFVQGKSGSYFSSGHDNLMEYPLQDESKLLSINTETWNVMHDLGWTVSPHDIEIECDSADVLGYGSVYRTLNFKAKSVSDGSLQSATWRYQVLDTITRTYKNVSSATGTIFTVTPTLEPSSVDPYAFQQARVCCTVAGKEYSLPLSLDVVPLIKDIKIFNKKDLGNNCYSFDILVHQSGNELGWVYVSDGRQTASTHKVTGDTIHVNSIYSTKNIVIAVDLENEYGFATRTYEFIASENKMIAAENNPKLQMTVNGEQGTTVLHDGDNVVLSLTNIDGYTVNSIQWQACCKMDNGEYYIYTISEEEPCTFTVTPEMFGCYFVKNKDIKKNNDGWYWDNLVSVNPDSCYFLCTVNLQKNKRIISYSLTTSYIKFDVLPESPTIEILSVWDDNIEGWDHPMLKIKISTSNFDRGLIYIGQENVGLPSYLFTQFDETSDLNFVIDTYEWGNTLYCWVANAYGQSGSEQVKASTNGIAQTFDQGCTLYVENNVLHVQSESPVDVEVFTIDGQQTGRCLSTTHYTQQLAPGLHLAKTRDCRTKSVSVRKIVVK